MLTKVSFPNLSDVQSDSGITFERVGNSTSIDFSSLKVLDGDLVLLAILGCTYSACLYTRQCKPISNSTLA